MSFCSDLTKERILECAKEEFLKKGYREAQLKDIASAAKVTTGAIYRHFESKEELFYALVQEVYVSTIMSHKATYDTLAGDVGSRLSGGERQRITIARAMLKKADIVILDEATAYADPENEAMIQTAISSLTKDKTLIVVAHRLATIQNADTILVTEHGKIAGSGRHSELLENCPL